MKRMTLISLALAAALGAGLAIAQPSAGSRPDPEAHLQNLSVILELSPQQEAQLRGMLEAKREELVARREAGGEAREQRRAEREADRQAFEQEIAAMLDESQKAKFEAIKAERMHQRERRHARRDPRHGEG